jgi:hypothetical protein
MDIWFEKYEADGRRYGRSKYIARLQQNFTQRLVVNRKHVKEGQAQTELRFRSYRELWETRVV